VLDRIHHEQKIRGRAQMTEEAMTAEIAEMQAENTF